MNRFPMPPYFDRELSWLSFNARVLQEAEDPSVPLFERLTFLAIFSSNLDEFFRVRVASLRSLLRLKKKKVKKLDFAPQELLQEILDVVTVQQERFGRILRSQILPELEQHGVVLIDDRELTDERSGRLKTFFWDEVAPRLNPVLIDRKGAPPFLQNKRLYLVTELWRRDGGVRFSDVEATYALVEVPSPPVSRFVTVPGEEASHQVLFLDDVIRYFLPLLFLDYDVGSAYAVKLSRDADLYLEDEFSGNLKEVIEKALAKRETGLPTRYLYDQRMPHGMLAFLVDRLGLQNEDLVEGWRYHNLNDFFGFPRCGLEGLSYTSLPPQSHFTLDAFPTIRAAVAEKDQLVSFPYQSFEYVLRFLKEAAADPDVEAIWITLYRVADDSGVASALLAAAEQGKRVTAFVEAKARFDEETNLQWAERMEAAGVRVIYSIPGLKVHTKLALYERREGGDRRRYAYLGTGNFNEKTARVYADHGLLTADPRLTTDVRHVFSFLAGEDEQPAFDHLLIAPFYLRDAFYRLIDFEVNEAKAGRPARILAKMNSLEDRGIIDKLYAASRAGVEIRLIVRGICCLVPGVPRQSDTIRATSIVDRFLEHARAYIFHHGGEERLYLASADWMKRNLSRRVEVAFPIYDENVRRELFAILDLQQRDNTKARIIDAHQQNAYVQNDAPPVCAQIDTYRLYENG